ncbi:glycoside hydrolase family 15 protein [Cryptosporangium minutisporangium]|uniref:Glycoside hydrolase family 15 protein n=1 Tax=Cryptosporangium minutisporangium TaxID=113569 RepID=A0ABP6T551_9ACTN
MVGRIEDYAVIGDLHTAALVGTDGSIDWLCLPRFDSGACFAALLGDEENGHWRIAPVGQSVCTSRKYREDTLILETEWTTPEGTVRVIDLMPPRDDAVDVVRVVEGVSGRVSMRSVLRLRFDYGRIVPWVRHVNGEFAAVAGPDAVWLRSSVPLHGENRATIGDFTVGPGEYVPFVLTWRESWHTNDRDVDAIEQVNNTEVYWRSWIDGCRYEGRWADAVRRSLITLKALTYDPTGGIVAAATTSLPEQIGGPRNWDYRYCWLRDASFTLQALVSNGYDLEALAWRDWLLRAVAGDPSDLQIMYSIKGARRIDEWDVPWLSGYEKSTPVRIGNAASEQLQLDVWGEVLDCLHLAREAGIAGSDDAWHLQKRLVHHLESAWREPDNGLWEVRGDRQHFVHSKVLCWVAFDRMVKTAEQFGQDGDVERWRAIRDEIHAEVCAKGFDRTRNTFTQYYGSTGLDASLLLIPRLGFLPPSDPRVVGTVEAVQRELCVDGFVLRYRPEQEAVDGLPGGEGAFLACSFWLADALFLIGREEEAVALVDRLVALSSDTGLLAEEYDPVTKRHLGNTPQAFSHVALVNSAVLIGGA